MGTTTIMENWDPMEIGEGNSEQHDATPVPDDDFARSVKSVGNAMAVKMDPKLPQAARISGSACQTAVACSMGGRKAVESEGEKSSGVAAESAATYHSDAPRKTPKGEERKAREPAPARFRGEQASRQASRGAAVTRK